MRYAFIFLTAACLLLVATLSVHAGIAQAPAGRGAAPAGTGATQTAPAGARATAAPRGSATPATVQQLMRGILFPNSNVVFAAQSDDPEKVKKAEDPATATDPLASAYGGWEAVMNASLALNESARLLEVARVCSNGKPAPITGAVWRQGLRELREAGLVAYQAAKAKDQDKVLDAADKITTACSTCHDKYREKTPRCTP
jgi:hypothetical protein